MKATNTYATLQKRNTPFNWIVLLVAVWFFIPSLLMNRIWINLKDVHVQEQVVYGEPIYLEVDRVIIRDFEGSFTVSIRTENGELICQGKPDDTFIYRVENELPIPLTLTYWLGGPEKITRCRGNGFSTGVYYLDTCHTVVIGSAQIPIARRCISSNRFAIVPETSERVEEDA